MEEDFLEFKVSGPQGEQIPVETFLKMVNGMNNVVDEVDREISRDGKKSYKWRVADLRIGSNVMVQACDPFRSNIDPTFNLSKCIREGMSAIQSRQQSRPAGFSDKVLRTLRGVLTAIKPPYTLQITDRDDFVIPTTESIAQIDFWLEGQYQAVGTIEGNLENVASHEKLECAIFDRFGRRIPCTFTTDQKQKIKDVLFDKVAVRGLITYGSDGVPISMRIARVQQLRPPTRSIDQIVGTWDLEMTSSEYLEVLHGE